jgi:nitroreductase
VASLTNQKVKPSLLHLILERRSIRNFSKRDVSKKEIEIILEAGQRAPTSCGIQFYSYIQVNSQRKRKMILDLVKENKALETAPLWVFICCDAARPLKMFEHLQIDSYLGESTKLLHSLIDASLSAQNIVITAELLGLSSVFTIYHWGALEQISKLLALPMNVLPLLLLCIGYAKEKPPLRPRRSGRIIWHKNKYIMPKKKTLLKDYDRANRALKRTKYFDENVDGLAHHWEKKFTRNEWFFVKRI